MHDLPIYLAYRYVLRLTCIDINMDIIYIWLSERTRWLSRLERKSSKREIVGLSPAMCKNFFIL